MMYFYTHQINKKMKLNRTYCWKCVVILASMMGIVHTFML
jgi:hypothetical protein